MNYLLNILLLVEMLDVDGTSSDEVDADARLPRDDCAAMCDL